MAGRRPVRKHVAEVTVAAPAADLSAYHPVTVVVQLPDMVWIERFEEARPTGSGFKLGRRTKQGQPAQATGVVAFGLVVQQRPAERAFGGALEQDPALVRTQVPGQALSFCGAEWAKIMAGGRPARAAILSLRVRGHGHLPLAILRL